MNTSRIVVLAAVTVLAACAHAGEFVHSLSVSFTGYEGGETLADFPALVKLSNAIDGFDYAEFRQENGGDLRFFDENGTLLAHEIDTWDTNGVSTVWVKIPSFNASTTIIAKYGSDDPGTALAASEVWSNGYVGVWHLGESASPLAPSTPGASEFKTFDSGNAYRDTINGIEWAQEGVVGRSTKFGPNAVYTNSCLRALHRDEYEGMDALTVEAWACRDTNTVYNGYVLDMALHSNTNYAWRMYDTLASSTLRVKCEVCTTNESGTTVKTAVTSGTIAANAWIHQTFTYDSKSSNTKNAILYLDGQSKATAAGGDKPVKVTKSGILYLGNQQGFFKYTTPFPGRIDEVRVSNVARSPAWVKATHDTVRKSDFATYSLDERTLGVFGEAILVSSSIVAKGAFALAIQGDTLYCGAGDVLYVLDISNPLSPRSVGTLAGFSQLRQIAVEGDLLAISSRGGGAWLVDVSVRTAPRLLAHVDTVEQATGMEIAGNFMAIGQRSTGVELFDITDRTKPQHICLVKTQESQSCRYQNGILYSGDWHSGQVNLIDVTDISKAKIIGTTLMHGYGDGFDIDGDYIYASTGHHRIRGEVSGNDKPENNGMGHGIEIWNRHNPSNVTFVSRVQFPKFFRQGNDWWQCCEADGWVFCSDTHNGVFAVDARNPANAYVSDRFVDFNPSDTNAPSRCINSIAVGNGAVYATSGSGLWVIPCEYARYRAEVRGTELTQENLAWRDDYKTPSNSHFTAWIPDERGPVHSAAAYGGCYYAGCSYAGAYVIDARTLNTLRRIPCAYARDVYVRDGKLYIAQGDEGLGIYSLDDPANPVEERRIANLPKISHFEWVYVPNSRWAVCHARRNSGNWYFIDLSKDPAETVSYVMSTNLTKTVAGVSGMDWVRPFADELIGGKWLGYARTHGFFMWFDMSGDTPVCYDTTDTTSTIDNLSSRPNYIRTSSCCTPISSDKVLVSNSGDCFILDPELDHDPKVEAWPAFVFSNCSTPKPNGMSRWDGKTHVGFAAQQGRTIQMADFSVMDKPVLEWQESTKGCPENGVFDADGCFLVPCGYQGLLVQKRSEVPVPAPDSFAHSFDVSFAGYAGGETLVDFPALVRLSSAIEGFSYSGFSLQNGGDLRFFDAKGNLLSHEIDTWNPGGESTVWVKVPRLDATTVIKAAYGCAEPPANNPKDVWSNGYAGVWHLNETASPFANALQTGEDFTCSDSSLVGIGQGGIVGKSVKFDVVTSGSNAHKGCLSLDDSANKFAGKQQLVIEMWVCYHATDSNRRLLYRRNDGVTAWDFTHQYPDYAGNSKMTFALAATNMQESAARTNASPICRYDALAKGWMHLAVVYDSVEAKKALSYANGMNNGSSDDAKAVKEGWSTVPNAGSVFLGNIGATSTQAFPGSVDEVRIATVARSSDWMKATHDTVMKPDFATYSAVDVVNEGYAAWTGMNGIPGDPEQKHNGIAKGIRYAFDITPEKGPDEIGEPILKVVRDANGNPSVEARSLAEGRSDVTFGVLATEDLNDWSGAVLVPMEKSADDGLWKPSDSGDSSYVYPAKMFFKYTIDVD